MELHERLVAARKHAGFENATKAAEALGVAYQTYAGHENGNSGFRADKGELYARRFKVRFEWLMRGRGNMVGEEVPSTVPLMGYLGAGAVIEPDYEQIPPEGLDQVEVPFPLPADMIAFEVRGDSMLPAYKDRTKIIVYRDQKKPLEAFYGEEAAVLTADGRRFIKTIQRGSGGLVNLASWNAPLIEDQRLEWVGEIFAVLPPAAIRKAMKQGGVQGQLKLPETGTD